MIFSNSDVKFVLTFTAGMGAFWLSGHVPRYLPKGIIPHGVFGVTLLLGLALIMYGLSMFIWAWLMLSRPRSPKPALAAAISAVILALITSLTLTYTQLGTPHSQIGLVLLIFGLYVAYGLYFVIGWAIAGLLAKSKS